MTAINQILMLNLHEDIKNVIDVEDKSESEIQQEIESYIVTEGIARHLYNFTSEFTSNIKETGVWLSGFYGSGKSYFGKMLGYIIANPVINGTPARERFIPRVKGVSNESLLENSLRNLDSIKTKVVFLDAAKQNTENGLAFTLFANFLKSLNFREDMYGYIEYDLLIEGKYERFKQSVFELEGQEWDELKKVNTSVAKAMRKAFVEMGHTKEEYEETRKIYENLIKNFDANKLKNELEKYIKFNPDEILVFLCDEVSEAIRQEKFNLLDLEGISESLSSLNKKVWTIAIAQEKLDDVINNASISLNQLTKVTDRFKTKIHLESTEVDVIIRNRLLKKTEQGIKQLEDYYAKNEGNISDITNLKSSFPTQTKTAKDFSIYYPFHKYQFDILQKFLFSSNALTATQVAARGMIITAFDILRKQMRDKELFSFTTGYAICEEAQTAPPVELVNKYDTARQILKKSGSAIDGEKLLKTIHLLADSEAVNSSLENITKSYIADIESYYEVKPQIEQDLSLLIENKVILLSNNNYKITSDLESKILDEMNSIDVDLFIKKSRLIKHLINEKIFNEVSTYLDNSGNFKFSILSDQGDELVSSGAKDQKITVYNLFNISKDRQDFIEDIKLMTQANKEVITLIPQTENFEKIDKLILEVFRYEEIIKKYESEKDPNKRQIMREFDAICSEKKQNLRSMIEAAYKSSSLIYMYDEMILNADTFKGVIADTQRKMIKNVYTKRVSGQLAENITSKILSSSNDKLTDLFASPDFNFFDQHGNFIGDHLKVIEEVTAELSRFIDGKTLENKLAGAPWGYSFGTVVATLASLLRAGKLSVKHNGETYFSHDQQNVHEVFTNTTKFKQATFKSIIARLSAAQKQKVVETLMEMEVEDFISKKIDWNTNDYELAESIRLTAEYFIGVIATLSRNITSFDLKFRKIVELKDKLQPFTDKVTENNYIDKVEYFLNNQDDFTDALAQIKQAEKFIKSNLPKVEQFRKFATNVKTELEKAEKKDVQVNDAYDDLMRLYEEDLVKNFSQIHQLCQQIKDIYFRLFKVAAERMAHEYRVLLGEIDATERELSKYPADLNKQNIQKLDQLKSYVEKRIIGEPTLEWDVTCKKCGFSLSEIISYTIQKPLKSTDLAVLQSSLIKEAPQPAEVIEENVTVSDEVSVKPKRKQSFKVPRRVMTVQEYRTLLTQQLQAIATAQAHDEIEIDLVIEG